MCWRLLGRILQEIGWVRLAFLAPVVVAALGRVLLLAGPHPQGRWVLAIGMAALVASAHRQRDDLRFLAISAPRYRAWLAVEYVLWALPVVVGLLGFRAWGAAVLTLALVPWVAWLPAARDASRTQRRPRSIFRSEAFEWVSNWRRGVWLLWLVLLVGAVWQRSSPLGPVVALVVWLLASAAAYGMPEPVSMLTVAARTPGRFLGRRLVLGWCYGGLTALPFLWLLYQGPAGRGGALAVAVAWLTLLGMVILTKYAFYPNALHIRTIQGLVMAVAVALPGHPVYPALLLAALGGLIWQSQRRLRSVLGAR